MFTWMYEWVCQCRDMRMREKVCVCLSTPSLTTLLWEDKKETNQPTQPGKCPPASVSTSLAKLCVKITRSQWF